ncbi:intelectin-1-like [Oscarella lobularis]|uniref:intelectin-1-like n=1 Tax=Oscarella lobularis TaxID=121494 RepID=UPI003313603F
MTLHPYSCVFFLLLAALAAGARIESIRLADSHNYRVCDLETAGFVAFNYSDGLLMYCNGKEWRSIRGESTSSVNTKNNPGKSCKDIKQNDPNLPSGVYWINPDSSLYQGAFQVYCDMTTAGGGWSMCYTTDTAVKLKTEKIYNPQKPYGTVGYGADCSGIPFKEVLYVDHDANGLSAWFTRNTPGSIVTRTTDYNVPGNTYGFWTGHGAASTQYRYQFLICDNSDNERRYYPGYFMSGYTNCYKKCNHWCNDLSTPWYRTDGDFGTNRRDGIAFNANGHRNMGNKRMSVGIRL